MLGQFCGSGVRGVSSGFLSGWGGSPRLLLGSAHWVTDHCRFCGALASSGRLQTSLGSEVRVRRVSILTQWCESRLGWTWMDESEPIDPKTGHYPHLQSQQNRQRDKFFRTKGIKIDRRIDLFVRTWCILLIEWCLIFQSIQRPPWPRHGLGLAVQNRRGGLEDQREERLGRRDPHHAELGRWVCQETQIWGLELAEP